MNNEGRGTKGGGFGSVSRGSKGVRKGIDSMGSERRRSIGSERKRSRESDGR